MRVDTERLDVKKLARITVAIFILLAFSNLSLAEMADEIKSELDEHDVLPSMLSKDTENTKKTEDTRRNSAPSGSTGISSTGSGSNTAVSGTYTEPVKTDLYSQMKRYVGYYNAGIDEVPDAVKKVAGNDVILFDIDMNDNSNMRIKVVTEDGLITDFRKISGGEDIDPTVTVTGKENAIRGILKSDDPLAYLGMSLDNGSIDIECKGFLKKAALSALKAVV